jgi:alkyl sulfatase BDS1-like metallo-beta-lactamase superfamily hydrolase
VDGVLDLADRLWRGEARIEDHHPVSPRLELAELGDGTAFLASFANVSAFATGDGLVLVDTGSVFFARQIHELLRTWTALPLHTAVYSHGHVDHVFGVPVFEEEANRQGWARPVVLAHEAVPARFDRYVLTAGWNSAINERQFGLRVEWPTEYRYPDRTYRDRHAVEVGGVLFELHHARGETDDHTWTWVPDRKVLCTGDLVIWATPNAGNPQKVQRYAREWAAALREMAALGAETLLPGHGVPVVGADRVRTILTETAELLESLHDQTLALMNEGATLDDVLHTVRAPSHLLDRPWLRPVYDDPEFVVRNVWRYYGGWWDGDPSSLLPARRVAVAREVAGLAGGTHRLAARARELADAGDLRVAAHLAELAALAAPDDAGVHAVRAGVYERRVAAEPSLMAKGVFRQTAAESRAKGRPT